jgi:hypothetical protein
MVTDPNIVEFLTSLQTFYVNDAKKLEGGKHTYLQFPDALEQDDLAFAKGAETQYTDILKQKNDDQDPMEMITRGNSFYYIKALCKAHRLYRRSNLEQACLGLSYSSAIKKAVDSSKPSVIDNLKQVGTVVTPNIGGTQ